MLKLAQAIQSLAPDVQFKIRGSTTEDIIWLNDTHPTDSGLTAEVIRLQAVYDGNAFQRTRAAAYAELKEQFDLLYHDMTAGKGDATGEWYKSVKAVKDATPKP